MSNRRMFPNGAKFAFTIVDDTDNATVANVKPVYDLLTSLGLKITKTVWIYPPRDAFKGQCLLDPEYLQFIRELKNQGHEIALHNVGSGAFSRQEILDGLEIFRDRLGSYPELHTNHVSNPDNLYWTPNSRFRLPVAGLYYLLRLFMVLVSRRPLTPCSGDFQESPHFWGDAAARHLKYVRNLTFSTLDTLAVDPRMPYADPKKPFVRQWFSSSDGHTIAHFNALLTPSSIDQLENNGGASIIYTHFTDGFVSNGKVDPDFEQRIRSLAQRPGWFVPASRLLDWLDSQPGRPRASATYLRLLECRWIAERFRNYLRFGR